MCRCVYTKQNRFEWRRLLWTGHAKKRREKKLDRTRETKTTIHYAHKYNTNTQYINVWTFIFIRKLTFDASIGSNFHNRLIFDIHRKKKLFRIPNGIFSPIDAKNMWMNEWMKKKPRTKRKTHQNNQNFATAQSSIFFFSDASHWIGESIILLSQPKRYDKNGIMKRMTSSTFTADIQKRNITQVAHTAHTMIHDEDVSRVS